MKVELDRVPLRDATLSPEEILMSESQERMCAIVEPKHIDRFLEICKKWDVTVTVIGEVTDGDRLEITWHGDLIVDVPPRTVAHDGPVYNRPLAKPDYIDRVNAEVIDVALPNSADEIKAAVLKLAATPNLADKSWVTSQYDRYVQGNTIQSQPDDSGMVRIDEKTHLGVAVATDANANWSYLNPYEGAKLALAEAARNIATAGAKPLAVTNCLNFGSPEDPGVMWQFAESVRGLADGCLEMGLPVTGGNVSFYNQTGSVAILPTPVIGVLGVIQDVRTRTPMSFTKTDLDLYRIFTESVARSSNYLNRAKFTQLLNILGIIVDPGLVKDKNTYDDLVKRMSKHGKTANMPISLGMLPSHDHLFSPNPFDAVEFSPKTVSNSENSLLMNYGEIVDNNIYVCLADDVFASHEGSPQGSNERSGNNGTSKKLAKTMKKQCCKK